MAVAISRRLYCSKSIYNHHRALNDDHIDWFLTSEALTKARKQPTPHIVFMEGPIGSGKKDVLGRLSKLGYSTFIHDVYDIVNRTKNIDNTEKILLEEMEKVAEIINSKDFAPKENIVFHNRSFLSMDKHFIDPKKARMAIGEMFPNFSVILCKADPLIRQQRVGVRQYYADENNMEILSLLKELDQDLLDKQAETYHEYLGLNGVIFDDSIFTTSTKQGTAAILSLFGISPKLPKE